MLLINIKAISYEALSPNQDMDEIKSNRDIMKEYLGK